MEADRTPPDGAAAQRPPVEHRTSVGGAPHAQVRSHFVPILLLALAFIGWSAFQTAVLLREAESLKQVSAGQQRPVQESTRLRGALDGLARDMRKLADSGNAGASLVVEELRKRGVTINPENPGGAGGK